MRTSIFVATITGILLASFLSGCSKIPTDSQPLVINDWALATSEGRLESLDRATLVELSDAGFECIEIGMGRIRSADDLAVMQEQAKELNKLAEEIGVKIWSIHIPYGREIDISLIDPVERKEAVEELKRMFSLCEYLHPEKLVVHPSYELSRDIQQDEREKRLEACKESFNVLVKEAAIYGAKIAAECLPRTCLGNTSQEINEILDAVESLEVCCDVNHLLQETTQEFIRRVGSHITSLHISDYDGKDERHWIPMDPRGIMNWNEVLDSLVEIGYKGPFLFECAGTLQEKANCWIEMKDQYLNMSIK
jgi:sugar phosphate isomerase/epimerase